MTTNPPPTDKELEYLRAYCNRPDPHPDKADADEITLCLIRAYRELKAELAELRKDAERWRGLVAIVQDEDDGITFWHGMPGDAAALLWVIREVNGAWEEWKATPGEAIDAVIARHKEEQPTPAREPGGDGNG